MRQVYAAHARKVCLMCLRRIPVACAQLLIVNLLVREPRVAIRVATNSLRHLPVRALCPILDRT